MTDLTGLVSTATWESDHAGLTVRSHCRTPSMKTKACLPGMPDKGGESSSFLGTGQWEHTPELLSALGSHLPGGEGCEVKVCWTPVGPLQKSKPSRL